METENSVTCELESSVCASEKYDITPFLSGEMIINNFALFDLSCFQERREVIKRKINYFKEK